MVTTRPPKTIAKPTALGTVANTDTKLLIYGLFQKVRVLAQDGVAPPIPSLRANRGTRNIPGISNFRSHEPNPMTRRSCSQARAATVRMSR